MVVPIAYATYSDPSSQILFVCYMIEGATHIYCTLATVMFCVFGWALAMQFKEIQKQVDNGVQQGSHVDRLVTKWSTHHSSICWAVVKLGEYFSIILLLLIASIFARTSSLFFIIKDSENKDWFIMSITRTAQEFIHLCAICSTGDLLANKVGDYFFFIHLNE